MQRTTTRLRLTRDGAGWVKFWSPNSIPVEKRGMSGWYWERGVQRNYRALMTPQECWVVLGIRVPLHRILDIEVSVKAKRPAGRGVRRG